MQPKAFAAWRLSVWGWVLYKFHVRLRDNKSLLFLIRLTRVLITLSKIEEKEGNHHVTVYRDYRRRVGGLTAAYELLKKGQVSVTILEATGEIGGISRTKNYKGNRMDIGGHRFFSKSDKAMDFWKEIMPLEDRERGISPDQADLLFLIRHRLSRILFLRKFLIIL